MKIFKYSLLLFLSLFFRFFIRIDKKTLVFSARGGMGFEDNSKYLFLYSIANTDYNCWWITKNKDVLANKILENRVLYYFTFKALIVTLKANAIFFTHSYTDVLPIIYNNKTKLINLWHGIPIKKIAFLDKNQNLKSKFLYWLMSKRTSFFVSNKETFNEVYIKSFKLSKEKVIELGLPRIQFLMNPSKFRLKVINPFLKKEKNLLFAPTFRDYPFDYGPIFNENLNKQLLLNKSKLYLKFHPQERISLQNNFSNIQILNNNVEIYEALPFVDIFISDYSSLIIDFIVAFPNRRIYIYAPDYLEFESKRGFNFEFRRIFQEFFISDLTEIIDNLNETENLSYTSQPSIFFYTENLYNSCDEILNNIEK